MLSPIYFIPEGMKIDVTLSKYVSDDTYVKKQKEDIEELASKFKGLLDRTDDEEDSLAYIKDFES